MNLTNSQQVYFDILKKECFNKVQKLTKRNYDYITKKRILDTFQMLNTSSIAKMTIISALAFYHSLQLLFFGSQPASHYSSNSISSTIVTMLVVYMSSSD
jgi:hypothetical protein